MVEVARLRLFGDFALEDLSGAPIALPLRKAEAMLVYLALAPDGSSSREKLAPYCGAARINNGRGKACGRSCSP
jgi:hypothetical protein